jgi:hypothetical protein
MQTSVAYKESQTKEISHLADRPSPDGAEFLGVEAMQRIRTPTPLSWTAEATLLSKRASKRTLNNAWEYWLRRKYTNVGKGRTAERLKNRDKGSNLVTTGSSLRFTAKMFPLRVSIWVIRPSAKNSSH